MSVVMGPTETSAGTGTCFLQPVPVQQFAHRISSHIYRVDSGILFAACVFSLGRPTHPPKSDIDFECFAHVETSRFTVHGSVRTDRGNSCDA
ncbi:predicted protein [Plenodomus lingam JN3]|uniref:Predicted protein n=1 Tax=Leptosphaeria maculans (strain JN3 / isolate v23.1.3 / race Av1-4-5-6-7-8) TaxID=985895 RepID=E4ZLD5_LEPMJ|nr:predicted protein [Plenodomus lingam JN3]CBX92294.1 predicted protein [Plenodomus lingam JN3]